MRNDKKRPMEKRHKEWNTELAKKIKTRADTAFKEKCTFKEATQYFLNGNYSYAIIRVCSSKWNYKKRNTRNYFALAKKRFQDLWKVT